MIVTEYCIRLVKFDMEGNYIHSNTLYDKYYFVKEMKLRFRECVRLQVTHLVLTKQLSFTIYIKL